MQAVGHLSLHSLIIPEFFIDFYGRACARVHSRCLDQTRRMKQNTNEREILLEVLYCVITAEAIDRKIFNSIFSMVLPRASLEAGPVDLRFKNFFLIFNLRSEFFTVLISFSASKLKVAVIFLLLIARDDRQSRSPDSLRSDDI